MVDVKQAATVATSYFMELMGGTDKIIDILLEEIELTEDERFWLITLSALVPTPKEAIDATSMGVIAAIMQVPKWRRIYRIFKINTDTGTVKSMKMRQPNE